MNGTVYRHPLTFLLEAADDIAYATADLEDGFKKGMFTLDEFIQFFNDEWVKYEPKMKDKYQKRYTKGLFDKLEVYREQATSEIKKSVGNKDLYAMQNWTIYVRGWFTYCACFGFKRNYDEIMKGTYTKEIMP